MQLFDPVKFQHDIHNTILLAVETLQATEDAFTFFHKKYLSLLNSQAPLKFLTTKEHELEQKPWITKGLLVSIRVKSKLYKLFRNTKKKEFYNKFKTYRDIINSLLRKSKRQFYKKCSAEHSSNSKKTWSAINNILSRSKKNKSTDIFLNDNGKIIDNQNTVSTKFNNYFINVAYSLSKKITNPTSQDFLLKKLHSMKLN